MLIVVVIVAVIVVVIVVVIVLVIIVVIVVVIGFVIYDPQTPIMLKRVRRDFEPFKRLSYFTSGKNCYPYHSELVGSRND